MAAVFGECAKGQQTLKEVSYGSDLSLKVLHQLGFMGDVKFFEGAIFIGNHGVFG